MCIFSYGHCEPGNRFIFLIELASRNLVITSLLLLTDILWLIFLKGTGIYEIIPGFIAGLLVSVLVAKLTAAPSDEVTAIFDKVASGEEIESAQE